MTDTGWNVTGDERGSTSQFDGPTGGRDERRGPGRPLGDSRLPAHIMAAVRDTIRAAAATCVEPERLESSGPYEWLALVEQHDDELYQLVRSYVESCRFLDDLEQRGDGLGMSRTRLYEAVRTATFARESMRRSLAAGIARRPGGGLADV